MFFECDPEAVKRHSSSDVGLECARDAKAVSFDYQMDLRCRFQAVHNPHYFSPEAETTLHELANPQELHAACCNAARSNAYVNHFSNRLPAIFWFVPASVLKPVTGQKSTCAALVLRMVAKSVDAKVDEKDDGQVFRLLGLPTFGTQFPWAPTLLCGFTPAQCVLALVIAGHASARATPLHHNRSHLPSQT